RRRTSPPAPSPLLLIFRRNLLLQNTFRFDLDASSPIHHPLPQRTVPYLSGPRRVKPMFYQTEAKPQGWRAVAVFEDRPDALIYLGRSSTQVRAGFASAFFQVLDDEEREAVRSIRLERWHGAPDAGRWMQQTTLAVPMIAKVAQS